MCLWSASLRTDKWINDSQEHVRVWTILHWSLFSYSQWQRQQVNSSTFLINSFKPSSTCLLCFCWAICFCLFSFIFHFLCLKQTPLYKWSIIEPSSSLVLSLTEVSGSTPSTAMSSTRPRHTKSMSSSGHPSKSTLPPIDDNTELKARWAA